MIIFENNNLNSNFVRISSACKMIMNSSGSLTIINDVSKNFLIINGDENKLKELIDLLNNGTLKSKLYELIMNLGDSNLYNLLLGGFFLE